jgi:hypothetical protein
MLFAISCPDAGACTPDAAAAAASHQTATIEALSSTTAVIAAVATASVVISTGWGNPTFGTIMQLGTKDWISLSFAVLQVCPARGVWHSVRKRAQSISTNIMISLGGPCSVCLSGVLLTHNTATAELRATSYHYICLTAVLVF